ncbi:MAG: thermonuclease family protein [Nitrospirae bacterium]|nr:thermonuclease family protein [Nitrospirota bacterium]
MIKRSPLFFLILLFSGILSLSCNREGSLLNDHGGLPESALVEEAVDGDTVRISGGKLVRYIGIDAPELRRKSGGKWIYDPTPFSKEAYEVNKRLVEGKNVRLEYDKEKTDKYNRILAYLYVGDIFVNGEMIKTGLARASIYPPNEKYAGLLINLEKDAKESKMGMWGLNN